MKKNLSVAIATAASLWATSSTAAVLYQETGTTLFGDNVDVPVLQRATFDLPYSFSPQPIRLDFVLSDAEAVSGAYVLVRLLTHAFLDNGWEYLWHDDIIIFDPTTDGTAHDIFRWTSSNSGFSATVRPPTARCQSWAPPANCSYYEVADVTFYGTEISRPTGYTFTVSSVPEPATWAMMIVGFGAVGSMVRTSRRRNAAVLA